MDAHTRFERRSLRDVLIAQGVLTEETADELVTSARENNEPFGYVVVEAESVALTAWDLAKIVATHYNMPCLPISGFNFDESLMEGLPAATLYQYHVVPVGKFGDVRSFAVIEPPGRECIQALSEACGSSLFFFVSEAPEVRRILQEHVKMLDTKTDQSWQSIFDAAEQSVLDGDA